MSDEFTAVGGVIEMFMSRAEASIPKNDEDYTNPEDGLLYCGKCHTPKQCRVTMRGKEFTPYCTCKCEQERLAAEKKAFEQSQRTADGLRLRTVSGVSGSLTACRFENYSVTAENESAYKICGRYAERFGELPRKNQGLLLWGGVGTGKTFSAACIANALLDRGIPVVMTSFAKLLGKDKGFGIDEEFIAELNRASLLIIDDLGAERSTDFALEKVYSIIDSRYSTGLPMILTTNLDLQEMQRCTDIRYIRVYERILEVCYPVRLAGKSLRQDEARGRFAEMEEFLK